MSEFKCHCGRPRKWYNKFCGQRCSNKINGRKGGLADRKKIIRKRVLKPKILEAFGGRKSSDIMYNYCIKCEVALKFAGVLPYPEYPAGVDANDVWVCQNRGCPRYGLLSVVYKEDE